MLLDVERGDVVEVQIGNKCTIIRKISRVDYYNHAPVIHFENESWAAYRESVRKLDKEESMLWILENG